MCSSRSGFFCAVLVTLFCFQAVVAAGPLDRFKKKAANKIREYRSRRAPARRGSSGRQPRRFERVKAAARNKVQQYRRTARTIRRKYDRVKEVVREKARTARPILTRRAAEFQRRAVATYGRTRARFQTHLQVMGRLGRVQGLRFAARARALYERHAPAIRSAVMDPASQRRALLALSHVASIRSMVREEAGRRAYGVLSRLADRPLRSGRTIKDYLRGWAREKAPYLEGTDITEDPAALVAFGLIAHPKEYFFAEMQIVPVRGGKPRTVVEALAHTTVGDTDSILRIAQDMEDMETLMDGELGVGDIEVVARRLSER